MTRSLRLRPPFEGACLCGAVQVRALAIPVLTMMCHCRDCQKLTASAYSLTTMFARDDITITGPLRIGGRGTAERRHHFCKSCLGFIYSEIGAAGERINLRSSILDDAAQFAPFLEVMTSEKLPWVHGTVQRSYSRYPADPEGLKTLMTEYSDWLLASLNADP